jgi:hypothetical protein
LVIVLDVCRATLQHRLVVVDFSLVGEIRPDGSKGLSACSSITLGSWRCFFIVCLMSKLIMVDDCSLSGLVGVSADFPSRCRKLVTARDCLGELARLKRAEADGCGGRGCDGPRRSGPLTASELFLLKHFQVTA